MNILSLAVIAALGLPGLAPAQNVSEGPSRVQRQLMNLSLGSRLSSVKTIYPQTRAWPEILLSDRPSVIQYHVHRSYAKRLPRGVEILRLTFRAGRLSAVQAIYDAANSRKDPLESAIAELTRLYGTPEVKEGVRAWTDGEAVVRAFNEKIPAADGNGFEDRVSLELQELAPANPLE